MRTTDAVLWSPANGRISPCSRVPVQDIGRIRSLLTMVGGKAVHAAAPFEKLLPVARQ